MIITNYHAIRYQDTLNGPGFRTVIFVSGCEHHCKGCHNPETWDPDSGKPFTDKEMNEIIESLKNPDIDGITFSGGDPLYISNLSKVSEICKIIRNTPETKDKSIWLYTGYTLEERLTRYAALAKTVDDCILWHTFGEFTMMHEIFDLIDVLVDGPFIESLKDSNCQYAGSTNQRLIDMKATLATAKRTNLGSAISVEKVVLWHSKF